MKKKRGSLRMDLQLTFSIGPGENVKFGEAERKKLFKQVVKNVFYCSCYHFRPSPSLAVVDVEIKRLT